jgi:hypothetical protein
VTKDRIFLTCASKLVVSAANSKYRTKPTPE